MRRLRGRIDGVLCWTCLFIAITGAALLLGCKSQSGATSKPPVKDISAASLHVDNLKARAPFALANADPPLCTPAGSTDPNEHSIGGFSTRSVYQFASQPHIRNLYSRLIYVTEVCTTSTLSSADRKALEAILNAFKITKSKSFAATLSITGNGQGGIKYPLLSPFSYSFDQSKQTYAVQMIGQGVIPWQVTSSFDAQYSYNASSNLSINTTSLFGSITTAIAGAGGATSLLSPAANAYLSAGNTILQSIAQSVFTQVNSVNDSMHLDILRGNGDRTLTYRFRDTSNKPLAAIRLIVDFTNTIANPVSVDPTTEDSAHIPRFEALENILNVSVGGPSGGQTLLQQVSKEASYQAILQSTPDTSAQSFKQSCNNLESSLQSTYGLNIFDAALTMAQVLSQQSTLYLNSRKFYDSGCFQNRSVLKQMGITVFEQVPTQP